MSETLEKFKALFEILGVPLDSRGGLQIAITFLCTEIDLLKNQKTTDSDIEKP